MQKNYSRKVVYKEIFTLAWPSITEQLLMMMVGMVSTIFVGRIGKDYIAAVGMVNMLIFFFQAVFTGLATGSTVVIARIIGEGNKKGARIAMVQSLIMSLVAGASITILGYLLASPLLSLFLGSANVEVLNIGLHYFSIVLIGLPFMVVDMVIAGSMRGAGDTKTPMYVTGVVNIINIVLSIILVNGIVNNGHTIIPALGATGVAIAVTTARVCGGVIRLLVLYSGRGKLSLSLKDKFKIEKETMTRILKIGTPAFMEQFVMQGGFLIMQVLVMSLGTTSAAVYQIGVNVNSIAFMPIFGFAISATTMVGQALGSKNYDSAEIYAKETNNIAIVIITLTGVLMFIFARPLAMLYSKESDVIELSIHVIRIFAVLEPFLGLMNVCAGVLRAAGDIMYIMVSAIVGLWLFRIFTAYTLVRITNLGIYGVMIGVCLDFVVRAAMYGFRMKAGKWKYLKV